MTKEPEFKGIEGFGSTKLDIYHTIMTQELSKYKVSGYAPLSSHPVLKLKSVSAYIIWLCLMLRVGKITDTVVNGNIIWLNKMITGKTSVNKEFKKKIDEMTAKNKNNFYPGHSAIVKALLDLLPEEMKKPPEEVKAEEVKAE